MDKSEQKREKPELDPTSPEDRKSIRMLLDQRLSIQKQLELTKRLDAKYGPGKWRIPKGRLKKSFFGSPLSVWLREHGL